MLRDYQKRAIERLYAWFREHESGHPCLVLPTGSGKSHIVAALCRDAVTQWPETRVLMLTHVKELIEQNAEKMRLHWPGAPLGIYSASIGRRELDQITFAGIQSIRNRAEEIGHVDLIIIDECHLVSHKQEGGYRTLIEALLEINPALRVVGLTATPFRLGHGLITDEPALFSELIEPVRIEELIHKGFLAKLRSKSTEQGFDLSGVHKRGGEFIERELQEAVNDHLQNQRVVSEIISRSKGRKSWLLFCTGIDHAQAISDELEDQGIASACITGKTSKKERESLIEAFKLGLLQALTNANVLTTGFDYPEIDLIALLRPTLSPGLYMQMVGRGMRVKKDGGDCLVLDFAGNVERHGPIVAVEPPRKKRSDTKEAGEAPTKVCPKCSEILSASTRSCPCGHEFEIQKKKLELSDLDIMGIDAGPKREMIVSSWRWRKHRSRSSGKEMLAVSYYGAALSDPVVTEYFPVTHEGYAGNKARTTITDFLGPHSALHTFMQSEEANLESMAIALEGGAAPKRIVFHKDGKFYRVTERRFT